MWAHLDYWYSGPCAEVAICLPLSLPRPRVVARIPGFLKAAGNTLIRSKAAAGSGNRAANYTASAQRREKQKDLAKRRKGPRKNLLNHLKRGDNARSFSEKSQIRSVDGFSDTHFPLN